MLQAVVTLSSEKANMYACIYLSPRFNCSLFSIYTNRLTEYIYLCPVHWKISSLHTVYRDRLFRAVAEFPTISRDKTFL